MNFNFKEIFHKLTLIFYGDSSANDNELEKIIYHPDNGDGIYDMNPSLEGSSGPLYIPPCDEMPQSEYGNIKGMSRSGDLPQSPDKDAPLKESTVEDMPIKESIVEDAPIKEDIVEDAFIKDKTANSEVIGDKEASFSSSAKDDELMEDLALLISEMDSIRNRIDSAESQEIVRFCQERIIECLSKHELELVDKEKVFDSNLHTPIPFKIVPQGSEIRRYLRPGLKCHGKIILKAQVEV